MNDDAEGSGQRRVSSVRHAVAILRHLEEIGRGVGVNRVARALDLSPSSCFNLLKTLSDEQLVDFDSTTKLYSLGSAAIALGRRALDPHGSFELVRQRLEALADRHQVTVGLWRPRRGDQLTLIGYAESAAAFRIHLTVGQRLPNASGAGGRCMMAHSGLDDASIRRRIEAVKWGAPPDPDVYLAEVAAAREQGWAVDQGGFIKGVTTVAAPAFGRKGSVEFIITATMFTGQYDEDRLAKIAEDLRAVGGWLSSCLFAA